MGLWPAVTICLQFAFSLAPASLCLLSVCLQVASSLVTVSLCLASIWKAMLCGLVACCKFAYSLLPAWSQVACAWLQSQTMCLWAWSQFDDSVLQLDHSLLVLGSSVTSNGCVLMAWCQLVYCLFPAWSNFACAWVQFERNCVWPCGLVSICLHCAVSLATVSLCLVSGCFQLGPSVFVLGFTLKAIL